MKIKVVLHRSYGGFHLTKEMVDKMDALGFPWQDFGESQKPVSKYSDWCYIDKQDDFAFRSHPIFIQAVEELQKEYRKVYTTWYEQRKEYIFNLEIEEVSIEPVIENYCDGYETLTICGKDVLGYSY